MRAKDVMTRQVISVTPETSILEALRLMLAHKISGLPVINDIGILVGIVSEGDFLRRTETGTERRRSGWLQFLLGPGRLADDYVHSHGRKVQEVMTSDVVTVDENAELEEIVALMEKHHIKRVPVMDEDELVGIVTRANLLRAFVGSIGHLIPAPLGDEAIRSRVMAELDQQSWSPRNLFDVVVRNGAVELWGTVFDARQRDAVRVAAENVPGVKSVKSHLTWIEPMSGMAFADPDDEVDASAPPPSTRAESQKQAVNG